VLARRNEGTHRYREKYDSGTHGRDEHCPRVFTAAGGLVTRRYPWVRHFVLHSLKLSTDLLNSFSPLIGGVLSRPQDRWPHTFSHHFWADYPYFLPCLVASSFMCISFVISALFLEEVCSFLLFQESCAMTSPIDIEFEALGEVPACKN
jgi:hypothetical protein